MTGMAKDWIIEVLTLLILELYAKPSLLEHTTTYCSNECSHTKWQKWAWLLNVKSLSGPLNNLDIVAALTLIRLRVC